MVQDPLMLYKLIILYMVSKVNFPLTKAQVGDFILGHDYTNFMTLQQAISQLIDADMLTEKTIRNRTHLSITDTGSETLDFFVQRIPSAIRDEINEFFANNAYELRNDISIYSDYYKTTLGEYEACLVAKEKNINLIELKLSLPGEEIARDVCDKWEKNSEDIYKYIIDKLC